MITLAGLARLHEAYGADLALPVEPVQVGALTIGDEAPVLMGTVNLSRDSTYRESVAVSVDAAIRKVRVAAAEGAGIVDVGAESSTARAARVGVDGQIGALLPVLEAVAEEVVISVETYEPTVAERALAAGARMLNLTGREHEETILRIAAEHGAPVVMCFSPESNVRDVTDLPLEADPAPYLLDHFGPRLERAHTAGVQVIVDPGMGFFYGNLTDPLTRARHQARVLAQCFRLRPLGVPVCNALPHAFDLFEDEFRTAEGFFAVLTRLGGTHVLRTHEVARVRTVLTAMDALSLE